MNITKDSARRAIRLLERRGWHQGDAIGPDGSLCMASALAEGSIAAGGFAEMRDIADCWQRALGCILRAFPERVPEGRQTVADFNDDSRTTQEDVLLILKHMTEGE